jgi:hypothetical protein
MIVLLGAVGSAAQEGKFRMASTTIRVGLDSRIPAMIVDTYQGVVWTVPDLQVTNPTWYKTDLGQHGDTVLTGERYIGRLLDAQETELVAPAVILDSETGIIWNCPNIIDPSPTWTRRELK